MSGVTTRLSWTMYENYSRKCGKCCRFRTSRFVASSSKTLLREATAEVLIHKVYSHDLESASESPLEDFCRVGNNWADRQAEVSNSTRSPSFERIYSGYDFFQPVHSVFFRAAFHQVIQWISNIDNSSATSRPVSLLEMYVGYRLSLGEGSPPVSGDQVADKSATVTFASDYSYFKRVVTFRFGSQ